MPSTPIANTSPTSAALVSNPAAPPIPKIQLPPSSSSGKPHEQAIASEASKALALREQLASSSESESQTSEGSSADSLGEIVADILSEVEEGYVLTPPDFSIVKDGKFMQSPLVDILRKEPGDILKPGTISDQQKQALKALTRKIQSIDTTFRRSNLFKHSDFLEGTITGLDAKDTLDKTAEKATKELVEAFDELKAIPLGKESQECLNLLAKCMAYVIDHTIVETRIFLPLEQMFPHKYGEKREEFDTARQNAKEKSTVVRLAVELKKMLKGMPKAIQPHWERFSVFRDYIYCTEGSLYRKNSEHFSSLTKTNSQENFQQKALTDSALLLSNIMSTCMQVNGDFSLDPEAETSAANMLSSKKIQKFKDSAMSAHLKKYENMSWHKRVLKEMKGIHNFAAPSGETATCILNPPGKSEPAKSTREEMLKLADNLRLASHAYRELAEFFLEEVYENLTEADSSEIEKDAQQVYGHFETRAIFYEEFASLVKIYGEKHTKPALVSSSSKAPVTKEDVGVAQPKEKIKPQKKPKRKHRKTSSTASTASRSSTGEPSTRSRDRAEAPKQRSDAFSLFQTKAVPKTPTQEILKTFLPRYEEAERLREKGKSARKRMWTFPTHLSSIVFLENAKQQCRHARRQYDSAIQILEEHQRENIAQTSLQELEEHRLEVLLHEQAYDRYLNSRHIMYADEDLLFDLKDTISAKPSTDKNGEPKPYVELHDRETGQVKDRFVNIALDRDDYQSPDISDVSIPQNKIELHGHLDESYHFINLQTLLKDYRKNNAIITRWNIKSGITRFHGREFELRTGLTVQREHFEKYPELPLHFLEQAANYRE